MDDSTTKPGLPEADQVAAHAEAYPLPQGGGAWLFTSPGKEPGIIALRAVAGGLEMRNMSGASWIWFMPATWEAYTARPCDQRGTPLLLVERLRRIAEMRDEHIAAADKAFAEAIEALASARDERDRYREAAERLAGEAGILEEELDRLRRGDLADVRARLRQAARRVLELGRKVRSLQRGGAAIKAERFIAQRRFAAAEARAEAAEKERDAALARVKVAEVKSEAYDRVARALRLHPSEANRDRVVLQVQHAATARDEAQQTRDAAIARAEAAEKERDAERDVVANYKRVVAKYRDLLDQTGERLARLERERDDLQEALTGTEKERDALSATVKEHAEWHTARMRDEAAQHRRQRAALEKANDELKQRIHALQARVGELEPALVTSAQTWRETIELAQEMPDPLHPNGRCRCCGEGTCQWCRRQPEVVSLSELLSAPDSPEGKALRALVRAARERLAYWLGSSDTVLQHFASEYARPGMWADAAACLAALLARREEEAAPVPAKAQDQDRPTCGACQWRRYVSGMARNRDECHHPIRSVPVIAEHPSNGVRSDCPGFEPREKE